MEYIICLVGIALILLGLHFHNKHQKLRKSCTVRTTGEVVEIERREEERRGQDADGYEVTSITVAYYPVFQYQVGDQTMRQSSSVGTERPHFSDGQAVSVMYDPENPERFYVLEDKDSQRFGIYVMLCGVMTFIISVVFLFVRVNG